MGVDLSSICIGKNSDVARELDSLIIKEGIEKFNWASDELLRNPSLHCGKCLGRLVSFGKLQGLSLRHANCDFWLPHSFKKTLLCSKLKKHAKDLNIDRKCPSSSDDILNDEDYEIFCFFDTMFESWRVGSIPFLVQDLELLAQLLSIPKEILQLNHSELLEFSKKHHLTGESMLHASWLDIYIQSLICKEYGGIMGVFP